MTDPASPPPFPVSPRPHRLLRLCFWLPILAFVLLLFWFVRAHAASPPAPYNVGFTVASVPDGDGPPIQVGIWYPTRDPARPTRLGLEQQTVAAGGALSGTHLPLVVISHGNGGWFGGHLDTAQALAAAGFVVAAPTHTGDNYADQSRATDMGNRPRQLKRVVDWMLADWASHASLDASRIGAFGYSAGGFSVLALAGGEPDLTRMVEHCRDHREFYDCRLTAQHRPVVTRPGEWVHENRIKALVVAAPALGFTFDKAALSGVTQPVQLWRGENDEVLPHPFYAEAVRASLPKAPETHVVPNAGHYDFMPPCSAGLAAQAPVICVSRPGFDRAAFHTEFNKAVVAFFERTLG